MSGDTASNGQPNQECKGGHDKEAGDYKHG